MTQSTWYAAIDAEHCVGRHKALLATKGTQAGNMPA